MAKQSIEQMIDDRYDDEEVRKRVLEAVRANGTEEEILKGEKVLPDPQDAARWHKAEQEVEDRQRGEEMRRQQARPDAVVPAGGVAARPA